MHEGEVSKNKTLDAILQLGVVEMDPQYDHHASQFLASPKLGFVNSLDHLVDTLELENPLAFDENVHSVSTIKVSTIKPICPCMVQVVDAGVGLRSRSAAVRGAKHCSQDSRSRRPQLSVDFDRTADHAIS